LSKSTDLKVHSFIDKKVRRARANSSAINSDYSPTINDVRVALVSHRINREHALPRNPERNGILRSTDLVWLLSSIEDVSQNQFISHIFLSSNSHHAEIYTSKPVQRFFFRASWRQ
jgi:hypothetical protein